MKYRLHVYKRSRNQLQKNKNQFYYLKDGKIIYINNL